MKTLLSLLVMACALVSTSLGAQDKSSNTDKNGIAVQGYDVVSYFSDKTPSKGKESFASKHEGATYLFSSKAHKELFDKQPDKYVPQCGGYCAWGVAEKSSKFPINPETYKVIGGKLYLFFNGPMNGSVFNSLEPWNQSEAALLSKIETNWSALQNKH